MNPIKPRLCPETSIEVSNIDANAVGNINTSSNRIWEYLISLWQPHYSDVLLGESRDNLTLRTKVPLQGSIASHISHQFQINYSCLLELPTSGEFPLWNRGLPRIWNIREGRNVVIGSKLSVAVSKYLGPWRWPLSGIEICRGRMYSGLAWMLSWACVASRRIGRTKVGYKQLMRVQN